MTFLGALLLCGVCDMIAASLAALVFLGALLLCGVCDILGVLFAPFAVSRSSSALWCLRPYEKDSGRALLGF